MIIEILADFHNEDWSTNVTGQKRQLENIRLESIDAEINFFQIGENLYMIELWGGLTERNAFFIVDNKTEAFNSLKEAFEYCWDQTNQEETDQLEKILKIYEHWKTE